MRDNPVPDVEWPTLILMTVTYTVWIVGTTFLAALWLPLAIVVTAIAIVQFSSLQHEALHGHPFRNKALNEALVFPGLNLCVPYGRFRDTHLAHHHDEILTDPYDDPETNYLDPEVWSRLPRWYQGLLRINNTLLGRILLGPVIGMLVFVRADFRLIRAGDRTVRRAWELHGLGVLIVLFWLFAVAAMPVWAYFVSAYLGLGILKIRSYLEHRAHERVKGRTVVVADRGLLALLFLNNNFHSVHHDHPGVPWYRLPALYDRDKARFLAGNDGYYYRSYAAIFRRYLFRAKDPVPHPTFRRH